MKKVIFLLITVFLCVFSLAGCSVTENTFVFGTFLDLCIKGGTSPSKTSDAIQNFIASLEPVISPTVGGSDLNKINAAEEGVAVVCSDTTMEILEVCQKVFEKSDGAFDPSVYPLVRLWRFSGDLFSLAGTENAPPSDAEIEAEKSKVGLLNAFSIDYENNTVTKKAGYLGAMLDFGGVAKGYAADKALDLVSEKQTALLNLGGNICAANSDYKIGIGNPRESASAYFGSFTLRAGECISTGGDYERYYVYEGIRYHHIIDSTTGKPSNRGLISVSVIGCDGALVDAVSTAVMVLGKEKGTRLLNEFSLKAVLIDEGLNYTVIGDLDFIKA